MLPPSASIAFIGFGEAGGILGQDLARQGCRVQAYDILLDAAATRAAVLSKLAAAGVDPVPDLAGALHGAKLVISAVTATAATDVARAAAPLLQAGQVFLDINSISLKQPVDVSFDAILGKNYKGTVVEVSQVGTVTQGAVNFTVTVELTNADAAIKPGMTAAVTVLVKQLDNVLLVPNRAVRVVDGQRIVYVLKNNLPVQVKIRLGSTSDTDSEVVGGDLKEGDLIILNPPSFGAAGPSSSGNGGG